MSINEFNGEHRWLSNFWPAQVELDGDVYPTVENAYQAAKTAQLFRAPFMRCKPHEAKQGGKRVLIREDWNEVRVDVMRKLIQQKFALGSHLGNKLLATGDTELIEGNTWGDTFWGVCNGVGKNNIGKLIMEQREALRSTLKDREVGHIRVGSKRAYGVKAEPGETQIDGDRKNPVLGNRHFLKDVNDFDERNRVIESFIKKDLLPDLEKGGPISKEVSSMAERVLSGEKIILMCWCAPMRCHCDSIASEVRKDVAKSLNKQSLKPN